MRSCGNLGIQPIRFCNMGHDGYTSERGDTSDFLNTKLRQNIAYAAYYDAKTIEEIASELGVSPVYVEDEVELLEEYGFMDKLNAGKYLTNILIQNIPTAISKEISKVHKEIANIICDEYVPIIEKKFSDYQNMGIYIPNNDISYLLYSLVSMALGGQYWERAINDPNILEGTHYLVKRKDGGEYIAHASIANDTMEQPTYDNHYKTCGAMTRGSFQYPISSWQISTDFDTREFGFIDNLTTDFEHLYLFINGKLDKNEGTIDKYHRLYKRGLIVHKNGQDEVNVVIIKVPEDGDVRNAGNN